MSLVRPRSFKAPVSALLRTLINLSKAVGS